MSVSARGSLMIPDMGLLLGRTSPRLEGRLSKPPSPNTWWIPESGRPCAPPPRVSPRLGGRESNPPSPSTCSTSDVGRVSPLLLGLEEKALLAPDCGLLRLLELQLGGRLSGPLLPVRRPSMVCITIVSRTSTTLVTDVGVLACVRVVCFFGPLLQLWTCFDHFFPSTRGVET